LPALRYPKKYIIKLESILTLFSFSLPAIGFSAANAGGVGKANKLL
jgi:hypothetical protein